MGQVTVADAVCRTLGRRGSRWRSVPGGHRRETADGQVERSGELLVWLWSHTLRRLTGPPGGRAADAATAAATAQYSLHGQ